MKRTSIIIYPLILTILILTLSCGGGSDENQISEKPGVNPVALIITPNTAMRIDPLIFSSRISLLKKGEVVEILDRSTEEKNIGKSRHYWYKVKLSNGVTGWIYGVNITILKNTDSKNVESYLSQFWEKETEELSTALNGKWWSVNRFNDFTNHCLEIYKNGKYKSYLKGSTKKIEGEYNFDFNKNQIIFLGETSFGSNLTFVRRGDVYTLGNETEKDEIKFKKINLNPESDNEEPALQKQNEAAEQQASDDESKAE